MINASAVKHRHSLGSGNREQGRIRRLIANCHRQMLIQAGAMWIVADGN